MLLAVEVIRQSEVVIHLARVVDFRRMRWKGLWIVPLGTPLLAGPGSIATAMILNDDPSGVTTTIIAIFVNVFLAWLILKLSGRLMRVLSPSILMILGTVMNILMAAIGVAFLLRGISAAFGFNFI